MFITKLIIYNEAFGLLLTYVSNIYIKKVFNNKNDAFVAKAGSWKWKFIAPSISCHVNSSMY